MKKPVIGIISKNLTVEDFYNWQWQRIGDKLRLSLVRNGALVLGILPQKNGDDFNQADEHEDKVMPIEETEAFVSLLKKCDGIVLQGGITSHYYEEFVARYCYYNDIPLIGICAGFNNIVRGLGGTTELTPDTDKHDRPDLKYSHECIVLDKTSLYYSCVQSERFPVNSIHTYIAKTVPEKLTVVAKSDDGQVEAVEAKGKRFFMGIKYHPEFLAETDEKQNGIFEKFVEACRK